MENASEATKDASDAPLKVEVTNFADFQEDLAKKVATAVVVAVAVGFVKIGMDVVNDKRVERKKAKAAKKANPSNETDK